MHETNSDESLGSCESSWSDDIERILKNILSNCSVLITAHKTTYLYYLNLLKYFRIPIILLASINSVFSVGLNQFVKQDIVSVTNCLISLICACISSIELFLNIYKNQEVELNAYQGYQDIAVRIGTTLKLDRCNRDTHGPQFLTSILHEYKQFFDNSLVLIYNLPDQIIELDDIGFKNKLHVMEKAPSFSSIDRVL